MTGFDTLNIAVFGAGSIGCYLGGVLANAGCKLTFIGRERIKWGVNMRGLTLTHFKRPPIKVESHQFTFHTEARRIEGADIVLLCVKSQDTISAARELAPHLGSNSIIVSFQNGVRNVDQIRSIIPNNLVLGGMVPFNVISPAIAEYHCGTEGELAIERSDSDKVKHLIRAFKAGGQAVRETKDMNAIQWGKLIINLNNALNTLHGDTLKTGLAQKHYRKALAAMMEEAVSVTGNAGIEVGSFGRTSPKKAINILRKPNWLYETISSNILKIDDSARSSMLDDLEAGKVSEINYLQGEIVQLAEETLQTAPINQVILEAVQAAFRTGQSPRLSGKNMWQLVEAAAKKSK